jgi:SAM-dependent methyltransferase
MEKLYGRLDYWESRYSRDTEYFDWYQRWPHIKPFVVEHVQKTGQILNLGCGNSRLTDEMYDDGYVNIMNIDYSSTVIRNMSEKLRERPEDTRRYQLMNAIELTFEPETFDLVIDKGCLDSVLCGERCTPNSLRMLAGIYRCLKPDGTYICVSYGVPDNRLDYLTRTEFNWDVKHVAIQKPMISTSVTTGVDDNQANNHFIYICKKQQSRAN